MANTPPERAPKPGLNIYGFDSPNPAKCRIMAEELGNYIGLDMSTGEMKADWYVASVNPNGKVPAIVHIKVDGTSVTLSWQVSGYGAMMGQAAYFNRYAPCEEEGKYGSWRYTAECRRLHDVLGKQLSTSRFVAADRLTFADFIFAHSAKWCGIDIHEFPHVKAWHATLAQRPAVQKALLVPQPWPFSDEAVSSHDEDKLGFLRMVRTFGTRGIKGAHDQWWKEAVSVPSDHANYEEEEGRQ
ncbi:hypothetical protein PG994_012631 [Apiospora phragmitis]|uniref:GST C-terminal domain-containing protein n=1 Tax=Apiospora phragmitis TaxID=2905665 RepID=A0ABR1TB20_9PEZI